MSTSLFRWPRKDEGDFVIEANGAVLEGWQCRFPELNVLAELQAMDAWLEANPTRRKKNYPRFVVNWLKKRQDDYNNRPAKYAREDAKRDFERSERLAWKPRKPTEEERMQTRADLAKLHEQGYIADDAWHDLQERWEAERADRD